MLPMPAQIDLQPSAPVTQWPWTPVVSVMHWHQPNLTLVRSMSVSNCCCVHLTTGVGAIRRAGGAAAGLPFAPGVGAADAAGGGACPVSISLPESGGIVTVPVIAPVLASRAAKLTSPSSTPTDIRSGESSTNQSVERAAATPVAVSTSKFDGWLIVETTACKSPVSSPSFASRCCPLVDIA